MTKKRLEVIDFLRGLAIIIVIFTHTASYFLSQKKIFFIWDIVHFTVPIFVFCSSYIFYQFPPHIEKEGLFNYFKKRLFRLLVPYWMFLIPLFILTKYFDPKKFTLTEFIKNLIFTGSASMSWLVVLFIYLMILSPLLYYWKKNKGWLMTVYTILALIISVVFLFLSPKINFLWTMWLPWSIIIIFSFYFAENEKSKSFILKITLVAIMIFTALRYFLTLNHHTLVLQYNKYPPNLYYLSYGVFWIGLLQLIYKKILYRVTSLNKFSSFFSRYSYEIFFIHFLVIYVVSLSKYFKYLNHLSFFMVVFILTVIIQLVLNYIRKVLEKHVTIVA